MDNIFVGCQTRIESEQVIDCPDLKGENVEEQEKISYSQVLGNNVLCEMVKVAQIIRNRL
jgi:hypothetical protein